MRVTEHTFVTWDGEPLFYRLWHPPRTARGALLLFHRGHEHSGRFDELAEKLQSGDLLIAAWDARGHGRSPGDRGYAPSFASLVRDADCFARHISNEHGIDISDMAVVAHSIGAVVAATWVHDYAPPVRALVLASPAFKVRLYVPFALFFLRLQLLLRKKCFVKSYVRPGMLTHDPAEAESYARDPLVSRAVAVNLLVEMNDTASRIVKDAGAIQVPVLLLSSGRDYVVDISIQREFFGRLGSAVKESEEFHGFFHDLLHERERDRPIARIREFLNRAFADRPPRPRTPTNQNVYERLQQPAAALPALFWGSQRLFLKTAGKLSRGVSTGWRYGFDSGESLDHVYRNRAEGVTLAGRLIDRVYLNSPGWTGIRQRRAHLESLLDESIASLRDAGTPIHIFDPAAGGGRYVLETLSRLKGLPVTAALRDRSPSNVDAASHLARQLQLKNVTVGRGDAFDRSSLAGLSPRPTIAIVSGLYELFPDNSLVAESLLGLADAIASGGYLLYTNQPWHPQLEMIARVLDNREGRRWIMRCRPQAEMDALALAAGFRKVKTLADADGIFTVTLARRV